MNTIETNPSRRHLWSHRQPDGHAHETFKETPAGRARRTERRIVRGFYASLERFTAHRLTCDDLGALESRQTWRGL